MLTFWALTWTKTNLDLVRYFWDNYPMNFRLVYKNKKSGKIKLKVYSIKDLLKTKIDRKSLASVNRSTGLVDKNKNEIFEGDIFLPDNGGPYSEYAHYRPSFIYFDEHYSSFRLKADEDEDGIELNKFIYANHLEVAGNVHENPELLNLTHDDGEVDKDFLKLAQDYSKKSLAKN